MPYGNMNLLQAGKGGHDAGFVQLLFKWWNLIECLFIRSHCWFKFRDTMD